MTTLGSSAIMCVIECCKFVIMDRQTTANLPSPHSFVPSSYVRVLFFFFQAEDGIRDYKVTGVQTCALPICATPLNPPGRSSSRGGVGVQPDRPRAAPPARPCSHWRRLHRGERPVLNAPPCPIRARRC